MIVRSSFGSRRFALRLASIRPAGLVMSTAWPAMQQLPIDAQLMIIEYAFCTRDARQETMRDLNVFLAAVFSNDDWSLEIVDLGRWGPVTLGGGKAREAREREAARLEEATPVSAMMQRLMADADRRASDDLISERAAQRYGR